MKKIRKLLTALPISVVAIATPVIGLSSCKSDVKIVLSQTNLTINVGQCSILYATSNVWNSYANTKWTSSDPTVATVEKGMVKAIKKGTCVITATFSKGSATCNVTVNDQDVWDKVLTLSNNSIEKTAVLSFSKDATKPANLQYYDEESTKWKEVTDNIEISPKQNLRIKGNNINGFNVVKDDGSYSTNNISIQTKDKLIYDVDEQAEVTVSGCAISLIDNGGETSLDDWKMNDYCFSGLFQYSSAIKNISEDFFTHDKLLKLAPHCYERCFASCIKLANAPELPAASAYGGELVNNCYQKMFHHCWYLVKPPILPSHSLKKECYREMFMYCTSLCIVEAEAANCYRFFFCPESLPELATDNMFYACDTDVDATAQPKKIYLYSQQ